MAKGQPQLTLKPLRSDPGGEFMSNLAKQYFLDAGIILTTVITLLPRVEIQNRSNSPDPVDLTDTSQEQNTIEQVDIISQESIDPLAITDDADTWGNHAIAMAAMLTLAPQTNEEALSSGDQQHWSLAMKDELEKMSKYKVWEVVQ
uniref:Uncharacterized protein n=1 Tax=Kwoniella pini CBS 10737 TaxID=1296096 RepID=A0A1B9IA25_9TREE|nr:uncharacterized protein I206_01622 [Kwoniella pini CBS 10737]OCF52333.1 hypothetical protein I206_01622 [Kwoniella pini CBS 10737]